jgi:hypothetical protein
MVAVPFWLPVLLVLSLCSCVYNAQAKRIGAARLYLWMAVAVGCWIAYLVKTG